VKFAAVLVASGRPFVTDGNAMEASNSMVVGSVLWIDPPLSPERAALSRPKSNHVPSYCTTGHTTLVVTGEVCQLTAHGRDRMELLDAIDYRAMSRRSNPIRTRSGSDIAPQRLDVRPFLRCDWLYVTWHEYPELISDRHLRIPYDNLAIQLSPQAV
jgi:hypothetical protein